MSVNGLQRKHHRRDIVSAGVLALPAGEILAQCVNHWLCMGACMGRQQLFKSSIAIRDFGFAGFATDLVGQAIGDDG
ncbi:MAG: hypothetical protein RL520_124, partial [Pseudomonadota bacterium]